MIINGAVITIHPAVINPPKRLPRRLNWSWPNGVLISMPATVLGISPAQVEEFHAGNASDERTAFVNMVMWIEVQELMGMPSPSEFKH